MTVDQTTQMLYELADSRDLNSWLRLLAYIRGLPQTWPTRWPPRPAA